MLVVLTLRMRTSRLGTDYFSVWGSAVTTHLWEWHLYPWGKVSLCTNLTPRCSRCAAIRELAFYKSVGLWVSFCVALLPLTSLVLHGTHPLTPPTLFFCLGFLSVPKQTISVPTYNSWGKFYTDLINHKVAEIPKMLLLLPHWQGIKICVFRWTVLNVVRAHKRNKWRPLYLRSGRHGIKLCLWKQWTFAQMPHRGFLRSGHDESHILKSLFILSRRKQHHNEQSQYQQPTDEFHTKVLPVRPANGVCCQEEGYESKRINTHVYITW